MFLTGSPQQAQINATVPKVPMKGNISVGFLLYPVVTLDQ
jgi:hypothetical protein